MGGAHSTQTNIMVGKLEGKNHLEDLRVDGNIILE
jgi:hypothetical protein